MLMSIYLMYPQCCTKTMRRSLTVAKLVWTLVAASAHGVGLKSSFSITMMCHRCCSKCMVRCTGCPAATEMSADDVVAAVLGLTAGPNYKSELKQLNFKLPAKLSLKV